MTSEIASAVPLNSSSLAIVSFDPSHGTLRVNFVDGSQHSYHEVSEATFLDLLSADSKGWFFNRNIRGRYPFTQHQN